MEAQGLRISTRSGKGWPHFHRVRISHELNELNELNSFNSFNSWLIPLPSFLLNVLADLLIIGELPGLEFRIHERAVDTDFEAAAVGRNKHETLDSCLEVFDELVGQTDRLGFVVSNLAIDDFDFHLFPL